MLLTKAFILNPYQQRVYVKTPIPVYALPIQFGKELYTKSKKNDRPKPLQTMGL